jgi:hypothetical protein
MAKRLPVLNTGSGSATADTPQAEPPEGEAFAVADLHHAQLDWDALDCVLADLDDFTSITELQARGPAGDVSTVGDIVEARDMLVDGRIGGLQIVYRFADQVWCDTLLREDGGARLSRMLAPERPQDE